MKINTSHKKRNVIIIAGTVSLLVAALAAALLLPNSPISITHKQQDKTGSSIDYNKPTTEQKSAGEEQKKATAVPSQDTKTTTPAPNTTPDTSGAFGVSFTALSQVDGQVLVRNLIDTVSNSGTCTLTLTKGASTVVKQSDIQAGPSSSTCKGFNVPTSELSVGVWQVNVSVAIGSQRSSASKTITVQ